jgi:hypothetical protein
MLRFSLGDSQIGGGFAGPGCKGFVKVWGSRAPFLPIRSAG